MSGLQEADEALKRLRESAYALTIFDPDAMQRLEFAGWLKYADAVKTGSAWIAIFASALFHLERARRLVEARGVRAASWSH